MVMALAANMGKGEEHLNSAEIIGLQLLTHTIIMLHPTWCYGENEEGRMNGTHRMDINKKKNEFVDNVILRFISSQDSIIPFLIPIVKLFQSTTLSCQ